MRYLILTGMVVFLMAAALAEAAPEYKPVPAQLVQSRDGLGNVLTKLKAGEEVRVAYFGGSITAAAGWRVKTFQWLKETYPQAKLVEINAAIGRILYIP